MIAEEEEIDDTEDLNYETEKTISHAEGTAALHVALRYTEQQPDALPHNVLFLKRLRDNAARKRLSAQKQTNLDSFLLSRIPSIQRENIVIVKKFELQILMNLHVLDLPESDKHNFGIMSVCLSVCEHDKSKTIRAT
ncbi:hypothetical protein AVEN_261648-1 [Araneus ventricosus]|uniref:Uncharacterized protein n=1 Tax=Araneus ventricosus TaxID=182803 RepID=A0A4Y2HWH5_ARAVE|nr:hypothetical protein AVEN_261648-1 [Araneus ventricosus]